LPELIHPFPDLGNIIGINTAAAVCSDSDLIDIVGNVSCKFQKVFQFILVELNDVSLKDHLPEKVAPRLHSAIAEFAIDSIKLLTVHPDLQVEITAILVFFLIHFGVNLSFYFSVQGFRGGSPLTSGANCGLPLVRPRFAELAICVSPCGAILHLSLSAQMVSALSCVELERQRLYFSVPDRSAAVPMINILDKSQKVNESKIGYSSK
jgi:hypothetical protein